MDKVHLHWVLKALSLLILLIANSSASAAPVKKSKSGICHDITSPWYEKTTNFTPYDSLTDCLENGRLPKGFVRNDSKASAPNTTSHKRYNREYFEHWSDDDKDGINTRHELLIERSTSVLTYSKSGSTVVSGKWYDPYTGITFFKSRELDADHVISLAYSWDRGSKDWNADKRKAFANDPANIILTQASVNRSKSSKGFTEWQPPLHSYRCQFNIRVHRLMMKYDLKYLGNEERIMNRILKACE